MINLFWAVVGALLGFVLSRMYEWKKIRSRRADFTSTLKGFVVDLRQTLDACATITNVDEVGKLNLVELWIPPERVIDHLIMLSYSEDASLLANDVKLFLRNELWHNLEEARNAWVRRGFGLIGQSPMDVQKEALRGPLRKAIKSLDRLHAML